MNTTTQKTKKITGVNGAMKTEKKLTKRQLDFVALTKKAQEILSKLYKEGKVHVYDPVR